MLNSNYNNNIESNNFVYRNVTKSKNNNQLILLIITLLFILIVFKFEKNLLNIFRYNDFLKQTNTMLINHGFSLTKINIVGHYNLKEREIIEAAELRQNQSIFEINLNEVYNNLLLNEWVKNVQIKRTLPNSIEIKIKEKKPLAILQTKLGNKLITEDGSIISIANTNYFKNKLTIIIGENANHNAFLIINILKQNLDLFKHVWSISYVNNRRWNIHLNQGITILLPKFNQNKAWKTINLLHKKYQILDLGLTEIDLRNNSQILGIINLKKNKLKRKKVL
jgi:cell division septal protein FtsQ